jgi:cytochrome b
MNKTLIWDLPIRIFHWAFAGTLAASFVLAWVGEEQGRLFQLHIMFGLVAAFLLLLRIGLGLVGSRYARFADFPLSPAAIVRYFTGILTGAAGKYAGHNPGSALAACAMFVVVPLLVFTGIGRGGEAFEDVHAGLAYGLLGLIGLHLLGLAIHTIRHRENISAAMVTGRKTAPPEAALPSAHPVWGLVFLLVAAAWTGALFANHDSRAATVKLPVVGTVIHLGENEKWWKNLRREHD